MRSNLMFVASVKRVIKSILRLFIYYRALFGIVLSLKKVQKGGIKDFLCTFVLMI